MKFTSICSRVFSITCLFGFLLQLEQVSELYFRFLTSSKIEYRMREVDNYQTISFCPRFIDLLDRTRHKEYGIQPKGPRKLDDIIKEISTLTIKDILDLTPAESNVINDCTIRGNKLSAPVRLNQSECEKFFKVVKAVNGERVCYTFMPPKEANYSIGDVASSQTHSNTVYVLNLKPSLGKSIIAFFISYYHGVDGKIDPLDSRPFQAKFRNTRTFNQSKFAVYGDSTEIIRIPPPFDTMCTPGHNREACYEICLIDKFKTINRVPWSGYHRLHLEEKMFTALDLKNETMADVATKSFQECHSSCKFKRECFTQFSKTTIQEYLDTFYSNLAISSMVPTAHIVVAAVPCHSLIEYIIQIGSCFGVWFGLSIISINPMKLFINPRKLFRRNSSAVTRVVDAHPKKIFRLSKLLRRTSL